MINKTALIGLALVFLSLNASAKTCKFNSWDFAYAHLDNRPDILFGQVGMFEPDIFGVQKIKCPNLRQFKGSYQAVEADCPDTKVTVVDGLSLEVKNYRNFVGVNSGPYAALLETYNPFLDMKTVQLGDVVVEEWSHNGETVATYTMSRLKDKGLIIEVDSPYRSVKCSYRRK